MRSRPIATLLLPAGLLLAGPSGPAGIAEAGDITAFLQGGSPGSRSGTGFSVGLPVFTEVIGLEGEYSVTGSTLDSPSLRIWSGGVRLTAPVELLRLRPYFLLGAGIYRQSDAVQTATAWTTTQGFGTFLRIIGPLHGRIDLRFFQLGGDDLQGRQRRLYFGGSLRF